MAADHPLLRDLEGPQEKPVGFVELFYDLVFVFAVTQVAHYLLEHLDPVGIARTMILFMAIWWSWINATWVTNWLDVERAPVRLLLFFMMGVGLVQAATIPQAFEGEAPIFAVCYVTIAVVRTGFTLWALTRVPDHSNRRSYMRLAAWTGFALPLWIAGAFLPAEARLIAWGAAIVVEFAGPLLGFPTPWLGRGSADEWDISGTHLSERCALFIIIALGESIIVIGRAYADVGDSPATLAAAGTAFVGSALLWWIYFDVGAKRAAKRIEEADNPGWLARTAYTYLHIPIVGGLIAIAAADEKTVSDPLAAADAKFMGVVAAGTILFLVGNMLFKGTTAANGQLPRSHMVGIGLGVALFAFAEGLPRLAVNAGAVAILLVVGVLERVLKSEPTPDEDDPNVVVEVEG